MPAAQIPPERDPFRFERFKPAICDVETANYNQRTAELRANWLRSLQQSTFLTVKYGLIDAEGALDRISHIGADWDSYGAEPPAANAISASRRILEELAVSMILPSVIVPSAEGGVSIYFITGHRTAYVESYNKGPQALVMYDQNGNADVLEIGRDIRLGDVGARILGYLD